jgi:hypothetical protein
MGSNIRRACKGRERSAAGQYPGVFSKIHGRASNCRYGIDERQQRGAASNLQPKRKRSLQPHPDGHRFGRRRKSGREREPVSGRKPISR